MAQILLELVKREEVSLLSLPIILILRRPIMLMIVLLRVTMPTMGMAMTAWAILTSLLFRVALLQLEFGWIPWVGTSSLTRFSNPW